MALCEEETWLPFGPGRRSWSRLRTDASPSFFQDELQYHVSAPVFVQVLREIEVRLRQALTAPTAPLIADQAEARLDGLLEAARRAYFLGG